MTTSTHVTSFQPAAGKDAGRAGTGRPPRVAEVPSVPRSAAAIAIGPVLQRLAAPVNDLSRGCLVPDVVNPVAITAIRAQQLAQEAQS